MRAYCTFFAAIFTAFCACSSSSATNTASSNPNASKGCGANTTSATSGFAQTNHISVSGADRTYSIYIPANYKSSTTYPVVYVLHGDGGTGADIRKSFDLEPAANESAILVYPDGAGQTWDTDDWVDNNKDVPYLDALFAQIDASLCVDQSRVFVAGFSRGAYMANQMGCWRGGVIRAISPNSGGGPYDGTGKNYDDNGNLVCPGKPIPSFMVHGDADQTVALSEGQKSLAYWTLADGCASATTATDPSPCESQNACTPSPVTFCKIPGLNHAPWTNAPTAVWAFFTAQN